LRRKPVSLIEKILLHADTHYDFFQITPFKLIAPVVCSGFINHNDLVTDKTSANRPYLL
jgi:hypothetical protein